MYVWIRGPRSAQNGESHAHKRTARAIVSIGAGHGNNVIKRIWGLGLWGVNGNITLKQVEIADTPFENVVFFSKTAHSQRRVLRFFVIHSLRWGWGDVGCARMPVWYFSTAGASPPSPPSPLLPPPSSPRASFCSSSPPRQITWFEIQALCGARLPL